MDIKTQLYHFLQTIPKGKVVTYKFLAHKFKIHPRYVGKILNQNQLPDVYPCYKVIKSDRTLGGYNGGVEIKIRRLTTDGIYPKGNKIEEKHIRQGE
jgi:O-6-methylguanine DNA methyltransferase